MSGTRKPRVTYPKAFKIEAVRLMSESDRPAAEIAVELGIRRNQLYKWKEQLATKGEEGLSSKLGRPLKKDQSELSILRQENERLREEIDILKKAATYFAQELK